MSKENNDIHKKYKDPDNWKQIIDNMEDLNNMDDKNKTNEICEFIEKIFPNWIVSHTTKYCQDYPHLEKNWLEICKIAKTDPKLIITVDYISFEKEYQILNRFCEIMTKNGCVIRRKEEIIFCTICNSAIPVEHIYKQMKEIKIQVPVKWSKYCSSCK